MTETSTTESLLNHKEQRNQLGELLRRTQDNIFKLNMRGFLDVIKQLTARIASDNFKVLVLGEFKRGKSTFINALLGQQVLPAFSVPCTAVINEVKWGEYKTAILHFRNPLPEQLPPTLPARAREHIARTPAGKAVEPMVISTTELEEYVVIPEPGRDQAESVADTPYDRVELFWPLELCKNGVEIIDSPGLNEHGIREKITMEYLTTVDAVIFVMSANALASASEMRVIDREVREAGHQEIFLVCNRFDEIRPQSERDRLMAFGRSKLASKTSFGEEGIFFVSALDALEGKMAGSPEQLQSSGMPPLEKKLAEFLVRDRGKIKLLQLARELRRAIVKARDETIPEQRAMLLKDLRTLQKRYDEVRPRLEEAEKKCEKIKGRIEDRRVLLRDAVRRETATQIREIAGMIPDWVNEFQAQAEIGFGDVVKFWQLKSKAEDLAKEVAGHLEDRIEENMRSWQKQHLQPLIRDKLGQLGDELEKPINEFLSDIEHIRADLSGVTSSRELDETKISGLERVLSAAGGLFLGGPGVAYLGAAFGYKEMVKGLVPAIGIFLGTMILGITNPFLILAALLGGGLLTGILKGGAISNQVKKATAEGIAERLKDQVGESSEKVAQAVYDKTANLANTIYQGLQKEIEGVRQQVEAVLADKRAGEPQVKAKLAALQAIETDIKQTEETLSEFIFNVAGNKKK